MKNMIFRRLQRFIIAAVIGRTNPVHWSCRYSFDMEDDEQGRWARIAFAGNKKLFIKGRKVWHELAWIQKVKTTKGLKFCTILQFPGENGLYDTSKDAMKAVEDSYRHFLKSSL